MANLSLIGINIGVILTCARGILTANKRPIREIKDSRMSPELPSWQKIPYIFYQTQAAKPTKCGLDSKEKTRHKKKNKTLTCSSGGGPEYKRVVRSI